MIVTTPETRAHDFAFNRLAAILDSNTWHEGWLPYDGLAFYLYGIWYAADLKESRDAMQDKIADKASRGDYN